MHGVPVWAGEVLAATGPVVVVAIQYRLGALGFLAADALRSLNAQGSTGAVCGVWCFACGARLTICAACSPPHTPPRSLPALPAPASSLSF